MTAIRADLPQDEQDAYDNGGLCFLSYNVLSRLDGSDIPYWSPDDNPAAATDTSNPDYPTYLMFDGHLHEGSRTTDTGLAAYYVHFYVPHGLSYTADAAAIYLNFVPAAIDTITIEIAHDSAFTTGPDGGAVAEVAHWDSIPAEFSGRLVAPFLGYIGVGFARSRFTTGAGGYYVRIAITMVSTSAPPDVGEVFFGRRRQLSRPPDFPWDDEPRGVDAAHYRAKGRAGQRYVRASGFSDHELNLRPCGADLYGLDDVATLRALWTDTQSTQWPVWFCNGRDLDQWHYSLITNDVLRIDLQDYIDRTLTLSVEEQPPFAKVDDFLAGT